MAPHLHASSTGNTDKCIVQGTCFETSSGVASVRGAYLGSRGLDDPFELDGRSMLMNSVWDTGLTGFTGLVFLELPSTKSFD